MWPSADLRLIYQFKHSSGLVSTRQIQCVFATDIAKQARAEGALAAAGSLSLPDGLPASRPVRLDPLHARQSLATAHVIVSSIVSSAGVRCHAYCCASLAVQHVRARSRDAPATPLAWTARGASSRASLASCSSLVWLACTHVPQVPHPKQLWT